MTRLITASHRTWIRSPWWLVLLLFAGLAASPVCEAKGEKEFQAGQKAEASKNYEEALTEYQKALQAEPDNAQYMLAVKRTRFQVGALHVEQGNKLREQGNLKEALAAYERAAAIDPSSPIAIQEIERTRALIEEQEKPAAEEETGVLSAEDALGPPQLEPLSRAPINLRISNDSKVVLETVGKLAGINVLFDPDYTSKRITVELNNVTLEEALNQVGVLTKTFWKPITRNTILVVPDTTVKRREQEQQIIKTFYLSNTITPQELTEVVTAIRSLLETRRIQQINSLNAIIIRDTPDKVAIAEKIIRDVDKAKPEIVVDVAVLEARRDRTQQLGLFPTSPAGPGIQIPVAATPRGTGGTDTETTTSTLPLNRLGTLSSADFSITLPGAQLNALLNDAHTKILQRPEIRASDGQKATLRVGDRVPIATGAFQPGVGGTVVSPLIQTQFQYTDVGVNLDITPKVHDNHEITLKVRIEVSAVTQQVSIGGIQQPVIGQRIIEHDIRLREGEINVLGGIFQRQNVETVTGIPGLAQIPLLRYIFSNVSTTIAEDEVLLVLRPHVVRRLNITALNRKAIDIGTEGDIRLRTPASLPATEPEPSPGNSPSPGPNASLHFPDLNLAPQAGETFEVPLRIENATEAASISFELSYDPQALKLLRTAKGSFLAKDGQPVAVVERAEEDSGKSSVTLSRPPGSQGVSGNGELAVFSFQALRPGTVRLGIVPGEERNASQQILPLQGSQTSILVH